VTDNVYCFVNIIQTDERIFATVQFEIINCLIFSSGLNGSLIIFIRTYTVNYRNALGRLRVRMNIILFTECHRAKLIRTCNSWSFPSSHDAMECAVPRVKVSIMNSRVLTAAEGPPWTMRNKW